MLRTTLVALTLGAAISAVSLPAMAQPTTAPAVAAAQTDVPVKHVALFSSGVGYFQHAGTISGDASTTVRFKAEQINDVLKSLILQDLDGGAVSIVRYPSQDPLGRALKGFQVDLTGDTSLPSLLTQLRGAEVDLDAQGGKFHGTILSVETRKKVVGQGSIDVPYLNIVTETGVKSIAIDDAQNIQFADKELQDELNKALAAVAGARDKEKKNVSIDFHGQGDRRVVLGYVVETPVWKTSYRLSISEKDAKLQGWAIVENQTDNDWNDISLSLVSGRPISFTMDLYEPLYLARPEAKLELFAGLTPQSYSEAREEVDAAKLAPASAAPTPMASMGGGGGGGFGGARRARTVTGALAADVDAPIDPNASVAAQASAGQIGELFEYTVPDVNLPRQSSAMIPIVADAIQVEKLSIYNRNVLARYPLNGARITNTTDKHLLQGPITVFEQGGYAGDAQINNVGPGQKRLISYGIDLQTLIDSDETGQTANIVSAKVTKGVLELQNKIVQKQTYKMENKSDKAKTIVIEQPRIGGWDLVDSPKPVEETDQLYRFEQKLDGKAAAKLEIKQQTIQYSSVELLNMDDNTLVYYSTNGEIAQPVRDALAKAITLRQAQADTQRLVTDTTGKINEITQEQTRIRENMKTVDKTSQYYTRLMTKLDQQESDIEKLQATLTDARKQLDQRKKDLADYLKGLNVG